MLRAKRKISFIRLIIFFGVFFVIVVSCWWLWASWSVSSKSNEVKVFVIPKGQAIDVMGKRLKEAGLIRSRVAFKLMVFKYDMSTKIQAGSFRLKPSMNLKTLVHELTHGTEDIWVTLLEGWRREEIAEELLQKLEDFDVHSFLQLTESDEGYLFPDTYLISNDASAQSIVNQLKNTFDKKVDMSRNSSGLTDKQVVILASILEREVRTDKDRSIVAGILIKRIENDWPLQADATVQYAKASVGCIVATGCDWWSQNLTKADIGMKSVYNTYENQGFPPTPIANPGLASIEAILNPKPSKYWFYISDLQGNIHYGETIEQHNANISRYLRK